MSATWEALARQHGRQVAPYLIADEERVIACPCGARFAPTESDPCRVCGSPLCPACDHAPNAGPRSVCWTCRQMGAWCDGCGAHARFGGPRGDDDPPGWAIDALAMVCGPCQTRREGD